MASWYRLQYFNQNTLEENRLDCLKGKKRRRMLKAFYITMSVFLLSMVSNRIQDKYFSEHPLELEYSILRTFPLKTYSKAVMAVSNIRLVWPFNVAVLGITKATLGISLEEAERKRLSEYRTINDLFSRKLDMAYRPVEEGPVSPSDGVVVYAGPADTETCLVKGVRYTKEKLLGVETVPLQNNPGTSLYQMVVYLAPSNYHRFHAFEDFLLTEVRHIPSQLFSVGRLPMKYLKGLLANNERVVLSGTTKWGYAALVAVGSTGVGSISTSLVPKLHTNQYFGSKEQSVYRVSRYLKKGEELGQFNMGSTVVLIFEASSNFQFTCAANDAIQVCESIGNDDGRDGSAVDGIDGQ
ncbi:phosphatidylserine decarboxylase [Nematocida sp. AWRm77]|nr:phosphatidylserine decarboxylase [Nematocida sp. AWRm77]